MANKHEQTPERAMVSVDAKALRTVLQALVGQPHHIREIQMTRSIAALTGDDPIQTLIDDFNASVNPATGVPQ
jgi:hypothetical protein